MKPEIDRTLRAADLRGWKEIGIEYRNREIPVRVPGGCVTLGMKEVKPLADPRRAIQEAMERPVGTPPLREIVRAKGRDPAALTVCIATSDITRPVPYKGDAGILHPLLDALRGAGVRPENVTLLVGTGTHRPSTAQEKVTMFGADVATAYRIVDHACDDDDNLVQVGKTRSGTDILVNRIFVEADLRIGTALVESHFMAGVSGGRKAVCPALVSRKTIERFHSAQFLDSPRATNLVLEGNPCHEEAVEIARRVGVDFIVNTVLDRSMALVGVYTGDLERSHEVAYRQVKGFAAVPIDHEYDIVLTHGGYVGINHYQNAKACCNALPAVRTGGVVILAACERDGDPIGPITYRTLLHLLKLQGWEGYLQTLLSPSWRFTRDQWEPQMWGKVLQKVGEEGLIYCSSVIPAPEAEIVPGRMGWEFIGDEAYSDDMERTRAMVQNAVVASVHHPRWRGAVPSIAFVREGPYAVPVREPR
ncbi:MAG TPA: nickel-dependent lactate racemase [Anaeromyxobacteraceae bacterium]|nr:nickel-dependent lactate racemase [Anaeromyxobacteraceae bacterium]